MSFEDFWEVADNVLKAFESVYSLIRITNRVGLRYVNVIDIKNGHPLDWEGLISPALTGQIDSFRSDDITCSRIVTQVVINRDDYRINFQHGLPNVSEYPGSIARKEFLLDLDCYEQGENEGVDLKERALLFHKEIQTLFENSIEDNLRENLNG